MKVRVVMGALLAGLSVAGASGCVREPEGQFVSSPRVTKLEAKAQDEIRKVLTDQLGTPLSLKLAGEPGVSAAKLKHGAEVYTRLCRQCHGVTGDGEGPSAKYMLPRPRDYRPGIFKFTSTIYGSKPLREDLIRTVTRGVAGTSMPSFRIYPREDIEAVVDYVIALSRRGELESLLADAIEFDGAIDTKAVPGMIETVTGKWNIARGQVVYPITPMPQLTTAYIQQGKEAFLTKGCSKCHGEDGRGQTKENIGVDSWGNATKAADLTSGMLRGGVEPLDVYRHISAGINGTPMPSFKDSLDKEPETMWKLTAFVLDLSNGRRKGTIPKAGLLKPLPGVEPQGAGAQPKAATLPMPGAVPVARVGHE
ncbi:MAG: c-type cytochrome [Isosphaeraceae bacterium]